MSKTQLEVAIVIEADKRSAEFIYNDANRMSQVKQAGVVAMNYAYNGKGEQVRKHLGASNTYTMYDESGHWLGDYDSTGAPLQQALWMDDPGSSPGQVLPVGLIANGNQLHYIQPDHLGTPRVVIEVARDVPVWTWDVKGEAFGNTAPNQNPDGDANTFVFDMRFPGQRFDAVSGMNYNYFQEYESATGRYPQSDPIGLLGGISTYAYVGGSPISFVDPLGLQSRDFEYIYKQSGATPPCVGYHHYNLWVPLCVGCTTTDAFNAMRNFSAPHAPPAQDGSRNLVLPGNNPINQTVDTCEKTITNVALPGHQFGGSVAISVIQKNGVVGAQIIGSGVGPNPVMNQLMGPVIFEYLGSRAAGSLQGSGP